MENFLSRVGGIQAELKAPKGQTNKFGGYKYRSCEDILEAVKPLLNKYKLVLTVGDDMFHIGDRYYICATATLRDMESDQEIKNSAYARESETKKGMDDSQITGTASSYARKYALNGLFCIDDTKDADTDEFTQRTTNTSICYCSDCKAEITDSKKRDGTDWFAYDIASYSKLRFGRLLCPDCQRRAFKAEKEAST